MINKPKHGPKQKAAKISNLLQKYFGISAIKRKFYKKIITNVCYTELRFKTVFRNEITNNIESLSYLNKVIL